MVFTREKALQYLTKILPVWPADEDTAALLTMQYGRTGWKFGYSSMTQQWVYASAMMCDYAVYDFAITKAQWEEHSAKVYGAGNDAEIDGDGDFAAMNRGGLQEKGDEFTEVVGDHIDQPAIQQMIEDATCVTCIAGHVYIAMNDHPLDDNDLPHCPHCMAEALSYISGFRVKG